MQYSGPSVDGGGTHVQTNSGTSGGAADFEHVGRNDPCPCGSGRKFKRCHGDPRMRP
jgi:preprotein translocase subunit SecA